MRIALLAHGLKTAGGLSVGLNVLSSLASIRPEHEYLIFVPDVADYRCIELPPKSNLEIYRGQGLRGRFNFETRELPAKIEEFDPDLVWGLGNLGLSRPPRFQAILVHKPQLVYPAKNRPGEALVRRIQNALIRRQLRKSLPRTQLVFCQTEVMKRRFCQVYKYEGRVEILPNAVSAQVDLDSNNEVPEALNKVREKFKLFVLTRYYAHKNLELLLDCFRKHRNELSDVVCLLTVSADHHPYARGFLHKIKSFGLQESVVNLGPLEQNRIGAFYKHTDALLLPTLLESFSGTYVEAMKLKRPIVTSDLDFARDVCGDAAVYFDPWSPKALCDAILRLKNDQVLRQTISEKGYARQIQFQRSWSEIVNQAMTAIEETVDN